MDFLPPRPAIQFIPTADSMEPVYGKMQAHYKNAWFQDVLKDNPNIEAILSYGDQKNDAYTLEQAVSKRSLKFCESISFLCRALNAPLSCLRKYFQIPSRSALSTAM